MKINRRFKSFLYIYALFFVLCFSVITMAKYTGVINKNKDIPVAKWSVSVAGDDSLTLPTIVIGDSNTYREYNLNVTSQSEVAINYSLIISNIPADLVVKIDNVNYPVDTGKITVNNLGSFDTNNATHTHKLKFMVPIGSSTIVGRELNIDVIFTQVTL